MANATPTAQDFLPETGFVRQPTVLRYIPVCASSWWAGINEGIYPKPVKIGVRTTAWRAEDIHALIKSLSNPEVA